MRKVWDAGGRALAGVFAAIMLVRRPRPVHPKGVVLTGTLTWNTPGPNARAGISWIDESSGSQPVVARVSRSIGLPDVLPDIIGLAFRVQTASGPADIELASTGFGFPSRFWLLPHRSASRARLGTLFPYEGVYGPILLCARTRHPLDLPAGTADVAATLSERDWLLDVYFASPRSKWRPFARLRLSRPPGVAIDTAQRFDAVRYPLPGAGTYEWSRRLREPSYRLAQHHRIAGRGR